MKITYNKKTKQFTATIRAKDGLCKFGMGVDKIGAFDRMVFDVQWMAELNAALHRAKVKFFKIAQGKGE